ncbi:hypothetical protein ACSHT0_01360 [Tepidicaulis sp. LMO-SS28]|uniref:hypothetical protein n=1 Tax=Tepidicaulis sp. LMO-SS28 TaxID=3447455 RepID=UPI003EDF00C3
MRFCGTMLAVLFLASLQTAEAARVTGTGSEVANDAFGTSETWGRPLEVPQDGKVVRVMGGTYGFQLIDADGEIAGDFLLPQDAVGFELPAGTYSIKPLLCRIHRHHHVEVTVEY